MGQSSLDPSNAAYTIDGPPLLSRELQRRIDDFMLRRTAELNERYLPGKILL